MILFCLPNKEFITKAPTSINEVGALYLIVSFISSIVLLPITQIKHRYNTYKAMIILSFKEELYHSYKIIIYIFVLINKPLTPKGE